MTDDTPATMPLLSAVEAVLGVRVGYQFFSHLCASAQISTRREQTIGMQMAWKWVAQKMRDGDFGMKRSKGPARTGAPGTSLDARQFPLSAQKEATAGREAVREVAYPVRAPRQSERRVERTSKNKG